LAARVAELQVILVPVSIASLGLAYYFAYRKGAGGRRQRLLLWLSTPVAVLFWFVPLLAR
jgi:hypothetical protein